MMDIDKLVLMINSATATFNYANAQSTIISQQMFVHQGMVCVCIATTWSNRILSSFADSINRFNCTLGYQKKDEIIFQQKCQRTCLSVQKKFSCRKAKRCGLRYYCY